MVLFCLSRCFFGYFGCLRANLFASMPLEHHLVWLIDSIHLSLRRAARSLITLLSMLRRWTSDACGFFKQPPMRSFQPVLALPALQRRFDPLCRRRSMIVYCDFDNDDDCDEFDAKGANEKLFVKALRNLGLG